jgi:hypothetical protein
MATAMSAGRAQIDARHAARLAGMERTRHLGDLLRFVADALQVGDGLHHGHDHAQVDRRRLAPGDHVVAGLVEFDLVPVDLAIIGDHLFDQAMSPDSRPSMARINCCSTSPPIASTRVRKPSRSASNCLTDMFLVHATR